MEINEASIGQIQSPLDIIIAWYDNLQDDHKSAIFYHFFNYNLIDSTYLFSKSNGHVGLYSQETRNEKLREFLLTYEPSHREIMEKTLLLKAYINLFVSGFNDIKSSEEKEEIIKKIRNKELERGKNVSEYQEKIDNLPDILNNWEESTKEWGNLLNSSLSDKNLRYWYKEEMNKFIGNDPIKQVIYDTINYMSF